MSAIPTSSIEPEYGTAMPCPYLGLRDDPVTHFAWDNPNHHCHRVDPPQPIRLIHQQGYCLSGRFETCPVRNDLSPSPSPSKYRKVFESNGLPVHLRLPGVQLPEIHWPELPRLSQIDFGENKRKVWGFAAAGLLVLLIILVAGTVFINAGGNGRGQAGVNGAASNSPAAAVVIDSPTATLTAPAVSSTPTASLTPSETPTQTPSPTIDLWATQTVLALTPLPSDTPTPPLFACDDIRAYTLQLVSGPVLSPDPGFVYDSGDAPPIVSATWLVQNTGACEWTSILLRSTTSGRLLVPLLYINDTLISPDPDNPQVLVRPGESIQVALNFSPEIASSISGDWYLVVENFNLPEQPHLTLQVVNWVTRIAATATTRPTSKPGTSPTQAPGTTEPETRVTPTEPATRP